MKSVLANLRSLTLPWTAGPGDVRVEINGEEGDEQGTITGWDAGGEVIWHLAVQDATEGLWSTRGAGGTTSSELQAANAFILIRSGELLFGGVGIDGPAEIRLLSQLSTSDLRIEAPDEAGHHGTIDISADQLRLADGPRGNNPVITISGLTGPLGQLTFAHGAAGTPSIILPILESPTGAAVRSIDGITDTEATMWTSIDDEDVAVLARALVLT